MQEEIPTLPEALTPEQELRVARLTEEQIAEIDDALLLNTTNRFRKAAMVIAMAMGNLEARSIRIPDLFYLSRLQKLVEKGLIESVGDLDYMRLSEVKLPSPNQTQIDRK